MCLKIKERKRGKKQWKQWWIDIFLFLARRLLVYVPNPHPKNERIARLDNKKETKSHMCFWVIHKARDALRACACIDAQLYSHSAVPPYSVAPSTRLAPPSPTLLLLYYALHYGVLRVAWPFHLEENVGPIKTKNLVLRSERSVKRSAPIISLADKFVAVLRLACMRSAIKRVTLERCLIWISVQIIYVISYQEDLGRFARAFGVNLFGKSTLVICKLIFKYMYR